VGIIIIIVTVIIIFTIIIFMYLLCLCHSDSLIKVVELHFFFLERSGNDYTLRHLHSQEDKILIQWKPLIMITLGPALFDNNNRLITLSGGYKNLHYLIRFIVTF
jgi:hypothetical protein